MSTQYAGNLTSNVTQSNKVVAGPSQVKDFWAELFWEAHSYHPYEQADGAATLLSISSLMNLRGTSVTMLEEGCHSQE